MAAYPDPSVRCKCSLAGSEDLRWPRTIHWRSAPYILSYVKGTSLGMTLISGGFLMTEDLTRVLAGANNASKATDRMFVSG